MLMMEEKAKYVVDSIKETINQSETYSFEENPAPIYKILLSKWEQVEDFQYTDFPNSIQNRWKKLISSGSAEEDSDMLQKIEEIINVAVDNDEISIREIIFDLSSRLERKDYIDKIRLLLDVAMIQELWDMLCNNEEFSFTDNPAPMFKMLFDKYLEFSNKRADELPKVLKTKYDSLCELSKDVDFEINKAFTEMPMLI